MMNTRILLLALLFMVTQLIALPLGLSQDS